MPEITSGRGRTIRAWGSLVLALLATALVLAVAAFGGAGLPPLGDAVNPGSGVWHLAPEATGVNSGTFALSGLHAPATVAFESDGIPHITTGNDDDLWAVIGYLQAKFRLTQMDLERREGSGTLAQVIGPAAVDSDKLELGLGLRRAAERDWATLPAGPGRSALTSYTAGINSAIGQLESAHELPAIFDLLGYQPATWTPVDTLVIQGLETQDLSYTTDAATYSKLATALGPQTFGDLFPSIPPGQQQPYDPGPYTTAPPTPLPVRADPATDVSYKSPPATKSGTGNIDVPALLAALPVNEVHTFSDSNAFAISGTNTASGKPLQESDPHLGFSLPAIWYQVEASSPGYHFAGVTIPGTPVPLIGRTNTFSWGITDAQHPTTLLYLPKTDPAKPGQYFWKGAWHTESQLNYTIAVHGAADVPYTVRFGAQGPILDVEGVTAAVWWGGTLPSQNVTAVLDMLHAKDFTSFRAALRPWVTPPQNFVYADASGTIGVFGVGVAPQVPGHDIGLPLPGDGSADVAGTIPYDQLPHAENPAQGYVVTSNQREVAANYPYQYDTSFNFPDQGWRAGEIVDQIKADLATGSKLTAQDVQRIQNDQHDPLAQQVLPTLKQTLRSATLNPTEQQVYSALSSWDDDMVTGSPAPTVFQTLMDHLVYLVFQPYYPKAGDLALQPFAGSSSSDVLQRQLGVWLQQNQYNAYLTGPDVLLTAFRQTVAELTHEYGTDLANWDYGKHHDVAFPSLLQSDALTGGPFPHGGSPRTVNAADDPKTVNGVPDTATAGPSWRFVMDWGSGTAEGTYPGGQSESPLSPWYENNLPLWLTGRLRPIDYASTPAAPDTVATWRFTR